MRHSTILAAGLALGALSLPAAAQIAAPPPLSYVQPVPAQAVQSVQDKLRQSGVYAGKIDGVWGVDSQAALERFQQAHQLQVTGQLNQATVATLGLDPTVFATPAPTPPLATAAVAPAPVPPPDHLLPASVRAVQARLRAMGFYGGAVDGNWGVNTQLAIEHLQRSRGLQTDGQLGPETITAMGIAPDTLAYR